MAGGLLCLGYTVLKNKNNQSVFLLSLVFGYASSYHQIPAFRIFFYGQYRFTGVQSVLLKLSAGDKTFLSGTGSGMVSPVINSSVSPVDTEINNSRKKTIPAKKRFKENKSNQPAKLPTNSNKFLKNSIVISVFLLTAAMLAISISQDVAYGLSTRNMKYRLTG